MCRFRAVNLDWPPVFLYTFYAAENMIRIALLRWGE